MKLPIPKRYVAPTAVLTKSKLVPITATRPVTTVVLKPLVTKPRQAKTVVTKPLLPPRRHLNRRPSPKVINFPPKVTVAKALMVNIVKSVQGKWEWKPKCPILDHEKGVIDSGCLRHMTTNMSYLFDFEAIIGGYVAFGGNPKGGKISSKGKIRTGKLDFDDVYFVKELKFNLFSVSQMCDKKNSVIFTDSEYLILSLKFKLPDENQVLLRVPRENNMYNVDLKHIVPSGDLTCLFAKATLDESNLWHRRMGNINFKTMNKLVKGNLVRGLPSKVFENDYSCVACKKGKQHKASCKLPEFEFHVSLSCSAQSKKHDDKTKREAKGKSLIESSTGYRNLSAKFEDFSDNNINEDNAVGSLVLVVRRISTNNTNTFSAAELEDITYSDDEKDVGAEANFTNLETTITVGKGFFGVDTPLFEGMLVAQQADEGAAEVNVDDVPAAGVADEGAASVNVNDIPTAVDEPSIPSPTPLLEIQKSI
nr:ribonuclease H-like domain-containing protein [Tanacetum cinerariifolium]